MSDPQPDIEAMALALPPEERERLAELLLESIEEDWTKDVDPATLAEWDRRYQELKSGKAKGIPRGSFRDFRGWREGVRTWAQGACSCEMSNCISGFWG